MRSERRRMFASFAVRNYRIFFAGALVSNVGTWVQRVGQDWLVLALRVAERGLDARELRRAADHLRQSLAQLSEAT